MIPFQKDDVIVGPSGNHYRVLSVEGSQRDRLRVRLCKGGYPQQVGIHNCREMILDRVAWERFRSVKEMPDGR